MDSTFDLHTNADGQYTAERMLLHAGVVQHRLARRKQLAEPEILFLAGGPASGKSTLSNTVETPSDAVHIDLDELREELPEYPQLLAVAPQDAARLTHREASDLTRLLVASAMVRHHNIVLDGVGGDDDGSFASKINAARTSGYTVDVCYATIPVSEALAREQARFEERHRRVPEEVVRAKHAEASRGIRTISQLEIRSIVVYDTLDADPRVIARGVGGFGLEGIEPVDPAEYAAFLEKGHA